jgi:hypothetical protein
VLSIHGLSYSELQEQAKQFGSFEDVGGRLLTKLNTWTIGLGAETPIIFTTWGGYSSRMYELFCLELVRSSLVELPHGRLLTLDLQRLIVVDKKPYKPIPSSLEATLHHLTFDALDSSGGATALQRASSLPATNPHWPNAVMAATIHHLAFKLNARASTLLPLAPFWEWAESMVAFERRMQLDPLPAEWQELAPDERPALLEFEPRPGCEPLGGPSKKLKAAVGLQPPVAACDAPSTINPEGDPNKAVTDLMLKIFDFLFDNHELPPPPGQAMGNSSQMSVLEIIVAATNAKAKELVVKEGRKFRLATDDDELDDALLVREALRAPSHLHCHIAVAHPHSSLALPHFSFVCPAQMSTAAGAHVRYRHPQLVSHPVDVDELVVFLGIRILMGGYWRERTAYFWNSVDSDMNVATISDTMTESRFEMLISALSFMDPEDDRWPTDKLRKILEVTHYLGVACRAAWDVEPDAIPDESRLKLSSRYCSFTTTLLCKPIKHGLTIYCLVFARSRFLYNFEWFAGARPPASLLAAHRSHTTPGAHRQGIGARQGAANR